MSLTLVDRELSSGSTTDAELFLLVNQQYGICSCQVLNGRHGLAVFKSESDALRYNEVQHSQAQLSRRFPDLEPLGVSLEEAIAIAKIKREQLLRQRPSVNLTHLWIFRSGYSLDLEREISIC